MTGTTTDLVTYHVAPGKAGRWVAYRRSTRAGGTPPDVCPLGTFIYRGNALAACANDHDLTRLHAVATRATVRIVRRTT